MHPMSDNCCRRSSCYRLQQLQWVNLVLTEWYYWHTPSEFMQTDQDWKGPQNSACASESSFSLSSTNWPCHHLICSCVSPGSCCQSPCSRRPPWSLHWCFGAGGTLCFSGLLSCRAIRSSKSRCGGISFPLLVLLQIALKVRRAFSFTGTWKAWCFPPLLECQWDPLLFSFHFTWKL